ncbi:MAG: hypothetical protein NVS2B7_06900 [Herpetosiphon sp.]
MPGIVYHLLKDGGTYSELGPAYFDQLSHEQLQRRLVHRLEALGYDVNITPVAA